MDVKGTWRGLTARSSWPAATVAKEAESGSLSQHELRQRHLRRLLTRGIPRWSEEPEHCDDCGRELLPGEPALLLRRGDALLLACPLCRERLFEEGCLRVVPETGDSPSEEGLHPLAA
jgi:hypothetical protein